MYNYDEIESVVNKIDSNKDISAADNFMAIPVTGKPLVSIKILYGYDKNNNPISGKRFFVPKDKFIETYQKLSWFFDEKQKRAFCEKGVDIFSSSFEAPVEEQKQVDKGGSDPLNLAGNTKTLYP